MSRTSKIVLTGGPSGGKTKALNMLKIKLEAYGIKVFTVTEAATGVLNSGFSGEKPSYEFQKAISLYQLEAENRAEELSKNYNAVIICDRGIMDSRVYLDDDDFIKLKNELNMNEVDMRDRYDAVFHLDSTSTDNRVIYENDDVRDETRLEAREINERSLRAWCGNPHYRFIPVCDSFKEKFDFLVKEIKSFLGIPKPLEIERKFLIKYPDTKYLLSLVCSKSEIEQSYMIGEEGKFRLRKRGENGSYIYMKTIKNMISETTREETEIRLSEDEYYNLLKNNLITGTIKKERYCLMYDGTYFEIDVFPFWKKQAYIEVELLDENCEVKFPEFIGIIREVTYDPKYKNSSLSRSIPDED
ncbi:MAG: AAA family ATPase [Ruminococcus sp.]|nr:AAA family ATPase [Ruminococcus sp.]